MSDDPVVERLDDALERVRDLERLAASDAGVSLVSVIGEVRAIRDDLLSERRDRVRRDHRVSSELTRLESNKADKNPNKGKALWIVLASASSAVFGFIVWLVQGGANPS